MRAVRTIWVLFLMPLFALLSAADGNVSTFESLRKGEALLASHQDKEFLHFVKLLGSDRNSWDVSILLIIKEQTSNGNVDAAKATYNSAKGKIARIGTFQSKLINAYCLLSLGNIDLAEQSADELGRSAHGTDRARAGEVIADCKYGKKEWHEAVDWIGKSLAFINSDYPTAEDKAYRDYLTKKQQRYISVDDLNLHGLGFYLYRSAQNERIENNAPQKAKPIFDKLIALANSNRANPNTAITGPDDPNLYKQPIPPAYEEAAYFYTAISSLEMGKRAECTNLLLAMMKQDKFGPYCGEAMRILCDNALAIDKNAAAAQSHYEDSVGWFIAFKAAPTVIAKFIPPEHSKEITKGADAMRTNKGWNDVQWFKQEPRQIYNSMTSTWYNDYQLLKCKYKLSFVQFLL